jgi:hypothetical protein
MIPKYDSATVKTVFYNTSERIYYLGIILCLAYGQSIFLEIGKEDPTNLYISLLQLFFSLFIFGIRPAFGYSENLGRILTEILMIAIAILEIESGFQDPDSDFHNPRNWLSLVALLVVWCFLFPGYPYKFILYWLGILSFYLGRVMIQSDMNFPEESWQDLSTIFPLFCFFFLIHNWWFRIRYLAVYRGHLLDEKNHSLLRGVKERIGNQLEDLINLLELSQKTSSWEKNDQRMIRIAKDILHILQNEVLEEEVDLIFRESFLRGMQAYLGQTYSQSERNIRFLLDDRFPDLELLKISEEEIYLWKILFQELALIDLKYCDGLTIWKVSRSGNLLILEQHINSPTDAAEFLGQIANQKLVSLIKKLNIQVETKHIVHPSIPGTREKFILRLEYPIR